MLETLLQPGETAERCGLILSNGDVIEIANVAPDPTLSYEMDSASVLKWLEDTVGTWHTHPDTDPNLSDEDHDGFMAWPDLTHSIIGRRGGEVVVVTYKVEDGVLVVCD